MSVEKWLESVPDNMVAIHYSGEPLHYLITPSAFPSIATGLLETLRTKLEETVKKYYLLNAYLGCTDKNDRNFDYKANVDDGSCGDLSKDHLFGGMYQKCNPISTDGGDLCKIKNLDRKNPMTDGYTCPDNYTTVQLLKGIAQDTPTTQSCRESCSGMLFWKECSRNCYTIYHHNNASFESFWCAEKPQSPKDSGFMFGGLYTSQTNNAVTKAKNCPPYYYDIPVGQQLRVCISNHYNTGKKFSLAFAGFFSCSNGNPMATEENSFMYAASVDDIFRHGCPAGYVQSPAVIDNDCEINYCVKSNKDFQVPQLVRPPFQDTAQLMYAAGNPKTEGLQVVTSDNETHGTNSAMVIDLGDFKIKILMGLLFAAICQGVY